MSRQELQVVVWTGRGCAACVRAKQLLDAKRVAFTERRLKPDPVIQRAFARATLGARTVPQIIVGGENEDRTTEGSEYGNVDLMIDETFGRGPRGQTDGMSR